MRRALQRSAALAGALAGVVACGDGSSGPSEAGPDIARGEQIYGNVCATCHGSDPAQEGTLGPAIAGSSQELVEAKVIRGEYPPGYTPKRGTKQMPPLPYLEEHVGDITAFLQAAGS